MCKSCYCRLRKMSCERCGKRFLISIKTIRAGRPPRRCPPCEEQQKAAAAAADSALLRPALAAPTASHTHAAAAERVADAPTSSPIVGSAQQEPSASSIPGVEDATRGTKRQCAELGAAEVHGSAKKRVVKEGDDFEEKILDEVRDEIRSDAVDEAERGDLAVVARARAASEAAALEELAKFFRLRCVEVKVERNKLRTLLVATRSKHQMNVERVAFYDSTVCALERALDEKQRSLNALNEKDRDALPSSS